ncbi:hypothetical protein PHMEG_00037199 [Phytophthora megakarya]|uniref:Uncharacterized protein n=1 Tax=Phytophthora megakarya TaxID=4795 RepID=A0A225UJL8_9STRA|nr:hypothetical protein PHMEG_00037199 [Phytophthora megakarya]
MYDNDPKSRGMDLPVCPEESIHLRPGQDAIVRIRYDQSNPQRELRKNWVTKVLYSARYSATAVKVVNVSDQNVWIDTRTGRVLWSMDNSQDSLDSFVLVKRGMKNGNN